MSSSRIHLHRRPISTLGRLVGLAHFILCKVHERSANLRLFRESRSSHYRVNHPERNNVPAKRLFLSTPGAAFDTQLRHHGMKRVASALVIKVEESFARLDDTDENTCTL